MRKTALSQEPTLFTGLRDTFLTESVRIVTFAGILFAREEAGMTRIVFYAAFWTRVTRPGVEESPFCAKVSESRKETESPLCAKVTESGILDLQPGPDSTLFLGSTGLNSTFWNRSLTF